MLEKLRADAWEINGDGGDIQTFIEESSFKIAAIANQMDSASDDATDFDSGMQMMELLQITTPFESQVGSKGSMI